MILLLKLRNDWLIGEVKELDVELGDPDLELTNPLILGIRLNRIYQTRKCHNAACGLWTVTL